MRSRLLVAYAWLPFVIVAAALALVPVEVAAVADPSRIVAVALTALITASLIRGFPRARPRVPLPSVPVRGLLWAPVVLVDLGDGAEARRSGELRVGLATLLSADRDAVIADAVARPVSRGLERAHARLAAARRSRSWLWRAFGRRVWPARLRPPGSFAAYWREEVAPCLDAGYVPPIAEGWLRRTDPRTQVRSPLRDPDRIERELVAALRGPDAMPLVPIAWDRVATAVWLPRIVECAAEYSGLLEGLTVADVVDAVAMNDTERWADALAAALIATLTVTGWRLTGRPGTFRVENDAGSVDPFRLVDAARGGGEPAGEWRTFAADQRIAVHPLALGVVAAAASAGAEELPLMTAERRLRGL